MGANEERIGWNGEAKNISNYLDAEWLRYAYERTRKDGAVGVDGQTGQEYAADLEPNLQSLLDRLKSGRYRPPCRVCLRSHRWIGDAGTQRHMRALAIVQLANRAPTLPRRG
jgi:hypothetical protein